MGGTALKTVETRRINRDEYDRLCRKILRTFKAFDVFELGRIDFPRTYRTKETFGDIDVLIATDNHLEFIKCLEPKEIVRNGPVTSIDLEGVQVDFILQNDRNSYNFNLNWLGSADLSNLIGRIARRCGFKFSHDGLVYVVRDKENSDNILREVYLTKNYREALEFLGFSYERFVQGFDTLEEIFEYVETSPYFQPSAFLFENLNHIQRIRDKKRPAYRAFVERCTGKVDTVSIDKDLMFHKAIFTFPNLKREYYDAMYDRDYAKVIKKYFDGVVISDATGYTGKELGAFMKWIRTTHPVLIENAGTHNWKELKKRYEEL